MNCGYHPTSLSIGELYSSSQFNMGILRRVTGVIDAITSDSDDDFERYLDKKYFYLMTIFAIYSKFNRRFWALSIFQVIFYVVVLFYNWLILVNATVVISRINMILFCQSAHITLLVQLALIFVIFYQQKRKKLKEMHLMMSSGFFDYHEPPLNGMDALNTSLKKERRMLNIIPICIGLSGCIFFILAPIVDNKVGTFDFSTTSRLFNDELPYAFMQIPHSTDTWITYSFALFTQGLCVLLTTGIISTIGFTYIFVAQHMTFELKILHLSIDNVEIRAKQLFVKLFGKTNQNKRGRQLHDDKYYSFCYSQCLNKNFKHHQIIMSMFEVLVELASVPLFFSYMTGTIVIALSLISMGSAKELPGTTVSAMMLCGVEVGNMFLLSMFGQRIDDLSQDLRFKIYFIRWYHCTEEVKRSLRIFQSITSRPLSIMAGGLVPANMETFGTVMNSAYSYYNLVNAYDMT